MSLVLPIARIAGVEIRVHVSWIVVLALVTASVGTELMVLFPAWSPVLAWVTSGTVALLVFASVTLHGLAHAVMARRRGLRVASITVQVFGGSAVFEERARRPVDDAAIGLAGPVASLVAGLAGVVLWQAALRIDGAVPEAIAMAGFLVGVFNIAVAALNLAPGFPLDGGRIVRAIAWRVSGSERTGMRVAIRVGRALGMVAIVVGVLVALAGSAPEGLVVLLSGWLLTTSARLMDQRLVIEQLTDGLIVGDAMEREVAGVPAGLTLDTFAADAVTDTRGSGLPVVRDGTTIGVIENTRLRRVARRRWPRLRASEVMIGLAELPALDPAVDLWSGLAQLQRSGLDALPVVGEDGLLGLLSRRGVTTALRTQAERRRMAAPLGRVGP